MKEQTKKPIDRFPKNESYEKVTVTKNNAPTPNRYVL